MTGISQFSHFRPPVSTSSVALSISPLRSSLLPAGPFPETRKPSLPDTSVDLASVRTTMVMPEPPDTPPGGSPPD